MVLGDNDLGRVTMVYLLIGLPGPVVMDFGVNRRCDHRRDCMRGWSSRRRFASLLRGMVLESYTPVLPWWLRSGCH